MTLAVDTLTLLVEGVAQRLAADADPALNIAWRTDGLYPAGQLGIYAAVIPTEPDRIISLSPRQLTADPTLPDAIYGLQARYRAGQDPRDVWAIRAAVRDVLLGDWPTVLPNGLAVQTIGFAGGTSLGQDAALRQEWSDNFLIGLGEHRATPY